MYGVWWSSPQHNEEILFFRALAMVQSTTAISSIKNSKLSLIFAKKDVLIKLAPAWTTLENKIEKVHFKTKYNLSKTT